MLGGVCCGPKVRGALGFSNEKSFVYWARTENFGPACGVSAPLPFCSAIVKSSLNAASSALWRPFTRRAGRLAWRRYPNKRAPLPSSSCSGNSTEQRLIGIAIGREAVALLVGGDGRTQGIADFSIDLADLVAHSLQLSLQFLNLCCVQRIVAGRPLSDETRGAR